MIIPNAKNTPLNQNSGTVPNVGGAMLDWFQPMVFGVVTKTVIDNQVVEDMESINFLGVWQPFSQRDLSILPEGQRAWSWYWLHADPSLSLEVDMIVNYLGKQYRVKALKNYTLYGYMEYQLIEDYTGSGPQEREAP